MRSKFILKYPDLKFVDYSQIYKDFETDNEEKLIEKVMVIATRFFFLSCALNDGCAVIRCLSV